MRALKPYPSYRESGVPWLGEVPAHWGVRRLKYLLRECDTRSVDGSEQLLRVSQYTGVTQRKLAGNEEEVDTRAESLINYKCVEPDDLVVNIMLAWNGSMGVSQFPGITSPAYCVYRFGVGSSPWYFHYLLRSPIYRSRIKAVSTGVVESRLRLYTDDLYCLEGLLPSLSEQTAIVRFLDHADRRIRRYICVKEKLIALLEEQNQAIIHQAVTGRIDVRTGQPYPAYKPSGVEWLGDVPAHWELKAAKWYFHEVDDRSETGLEELLSVSHITGVTPRSEKNVTMFKAESNIGYKMCSSNDLVVNTMWAWMAALGVARQAGIVSPSYAVYRPRHPSRLLGDYVDLLLRTTAYKSEYRRRSTGIRSSRLRLYPEELLRIKLLCPPPEEQRAIIEFVRRESGVQRRSICLAHQEIALLREYRARLIADVVTGKFDVREAAAALPEIDLLADDEEADDPLNAGEERGFDDEEARAEVVG